MFNEPLPIDLFFGLSVEKYYKNNDNCIGRSGDFITAPEASQMFCHAVGIWIYNQINHVKDKVSIIELGGGYGTLMAEILNLLGDKIAEVYFVEISSKMIERQKKAVSHHNNIKFHWVSSLKQIPKDRQYIVVANEFFDTLPIKQFIKASNGFRELYISNKMELIESKDLINNQIMEKITQYSNLKVEDYNEGDILEVSIVSLNILEEICKIASAALIIDYGYDISKKNNTIKAIDKHKILDQVLVEPGSADISAQVDFGVLENFITKHYPTYNTHYSTQREFLILHHIDIIKEKALIHAKNQFDIDCINSELNKIIVDMGNFKVLSFYSV